MLFNIKLITFPQIDLFIYLKIYQYYWLDFEFSDYKIIQLFFIF